MVLTRAYLKAQGQEKPKVKLADACDHFGIKRIGASHTAKIDCRHNYYLWEKLLTSNINYIDFIKTFKHSKEQEEENLLDLLNG